MSIRINRNITRWLIIISSFFIITLILWNTYMFFQNFKEEERTKMQNWSFANETLIATTNDDEIKMTSRILESNTTTPMILVNADDEITSFRNIDTLRMRVPKLALEKLKSTFENENKPIPVYIEDELYSTIYYGNSPLLNKLKYYPLALLLIIFLFAAVAYFFYKSSKTADQNKLWTGMAKETAHQIGTPLSSLVGWTEILRSENVDPDYLIEIEKDISRLQTITDRFSKIGSVPTLKQADIVHETIETFDYLKARFSKLIEFNLVAPQEEILVALNKQLYSWTIENLVKNAIDAMKGKGTLHLTMTQDDSYVKIKVSDTGKGIPKSHFKTVFRPGYTSKKRGWGLGLSLAKRIIEDYHKGKIKVLSSELGKGTTMQISLKKVS
ncbi:HAMP domain-containing histidine kinase [Subsaximicrobium wynnwilliamsii]|uniref:histidine kinase n=1 Tax=Subsaximicrobium wynnwilliamsii TaxID=291179 RepID=A0A5C6ZJW4_9FLAO|nr:HAMP domain-containing sensor histidine kinase [Subsaximicrobium wynnwilliamsii]TXD83688.1 HAMP domain-containing histidine kinase [Subsaximicrobium wynnwilliamsii]TXD89428.1 HAMP domain-containing histidine kinase [Subsaximicrobium wynnwilliamsii]TXE03525.1 HAMP domain-containing histidine kinase [Subsaximicrobium wynnwilliamsii]